MVNIPNWSSWTDKDKFDTGYFDGLHDDPDREHSIIMKIKEVDSRRSKNKNFKNMAYNNYNNRNDYNTNNQNGNGYRRSNGSNNRSQNQVKKSGATYSKINKGQREGLMCVNAWRKTKNGLMTASAFPVDGVQHESKEGNKSMRYAVEIINRDMGTTQTYWCMMSLVTKKIFIKELNLVISPKGNGIRSSGKRVTGYFGKAI